MYEICYCTTTARVYGLTSIHETGVAECQDARGFTQLVGTLVLEDPTLSAAFPRAVLFPLGLPDMSASSKTVIQHHGTLGSAQTSFCGWHGLGCAVRVLKRPAADGSDSGRNSEINVSLVFKPVADPPSLNAAICGTAVGDSSTEVSVTVNAASTLDATVPVQVPESFFYAICESPGDHFLGLITFRGRLLVAVVPLLLLLLACRVLSSWGYHGGADDKKNVFGLRHWTIPQLGSDQEGPMLFAAPPRWEE